jgi:hypothetical protein
MIVALPSATLSINENKSAQVTAPQPERLMHA